MDKKLDNNYVIRKLMFYAPFAFLFNKNLRKKLYKIKEYE